MSAHRTLGDGEGGAGLPVSLLSVSQPSHDYVYKRVCNICCGLVRLCLTLNAMHPPGLQCKCKAVIRCLWVVFIGELYRLLTHVIILFEICFHVSDSRVTFLRSLYVNYFILMDRRPGDLCSMFKYGAVGELGHSEVRYPWIPIHDHDRSVFHENVSWGWHYFSHQRWLCPESLVSPRIRMAFLSTIYKRRSEMSKMGWWAVCDSVDRRLIKCVTIKSPKRATYFQTGSSASCKETIYASFIRFNYCPSQAS